MNRYLAIIWMLGAMGGSALAQGDSHDLDLFKQIDTMPGATPSATPSPGEGKKDSTEQKEPTIITATTGATFDGALRMAIFTGDVHVKDPQFTLSSDKMTVFFKKEEKDKSKQGGSPKPATPNPVSPTVKPNASPGASPAPGQGGLERVIAEGNVVVVSDRPDQNGGQPVHYVGKGAKMDYDAVKGEAILYGWPQVQEGINTIVATDESTVIHLYRDRNMKVVGPHSVSINDTGPAKTPETK